MYDFRTLPIIILLVLTAGLAYGQQRQQQKPAHFWTQAEEREYNSCLPHSLEVWKNQKNAEDYCLIEEEHKRWLRHHPEVAGKKEIKGAMHECLERNKSKINGTWAEFRTAYDACMRTVYGLPAH